MKCGFCTGTLIWQSDADLNDIYEDVDGVTTTYICSDCGALWTGELVEEKKPLMLAMWGNMRSGKDTATDMLIDNFEADGKTVLRIAYADAITEIINKYFNITTGVKPREHYQHIGQSFRALEPNVWIDLLNSKIASSYENYDVIIVTDARQQNEFIDLSKQGFKHIYVWASEETRINRMKHKGEEIIMEQLLHETELYTRDKLKADYIMINDTDELADLDARVDSTYHRITEDLANG